MRIKIFAAALVLLPVVALAQSPPPPPKSAAPKLIALPGLEQFMGVILTNHAKLWLSAKASNWELAAYQLAEMKELLSQARDLVPTYNQLPIRQMIEQTAAMSIGPISELEKAVDAKDFERFAANFDKLTEACNSCHETAGLRFIVIRRPTASYYSNQDFEPRKQGGTAPK